MPQFPVDSQQGIIDGLNYVLSGPGGLGQDFQGFSSSGSGLQFDLTGNNRLPYTVENFNSFPIPNVSIYVAPIAISTVEFLDNRTIKATFATPYSPGFAPLVPGQGYGLTGTGFTPSDYDDLITYECYQIGVVTCTNTYVTFRLASPTTPIASGTGGSISIESMGFNLSTDCNAKVTVTGGEDRVVISAQLNNQIFYDCPTSGSFYYEVSVNRYKAFTNFDPTNPNYLFNLDGTVAFKSKLIPVVAGPSSTEVEETIFTSIIDQPGPGYYWYILEVKFVDNSGPVTVTNCIFTQRSLSAQVVKP